MGDFLQIWNGHRIPRAEIPKVPFADFYTMMTAFTANSGYLVQFFVHEEEGRFILTSVVRNSGLYVLSTEIEESYPSLTMHAGAKFNLFEREIAEQYGIRPIGHPWLKMVRYHANQTGRADVFGNDYSVDIPGNYKYFEVHGEAIHEVGVGPVHAGIIEPGHFRFQCAGEEVLHLEIQLGYQHRGLESMLTNVPQKRLPILCESIAGDTAIGHNLSCCEALEALAGLEPSEASSAVRIIALELERLANHVGDLGALSGDVAFNPPAAYFGRLRGEFLNLLLVLSGNRFGKSLIVPGGIRHGVEGRQVEIIGKKIKELRPELIHVCDLLLSAHTVQARFENTGKVTRKNADQIGLVGPCGRASGLEYDVREFFPTERFADLPENFNTHTRGDVYSRALVRRNEIMHSLDLVERLLSELEKDFAGKTQGKELALAKDSFVVTLTEGWRGEISHCILTDGKGKIARYKVKDPSFHNWTGLALALRNQQISDFPLCNKSFNLSYCGFDL